MHPQFVFFAYLSYFIKRIVETSNCWTSYSTNQQWLGSLQKKKLKPRNQGSLFPLVKYTKIFFAVKAEHPLHKPRDFYLVFIKNFKFCFQFFLFSQLHYQCHLHLLSFSTGITWLMLSFIFISKSSHDILPLKQNYFDIFPLK